MFQNKLHGFVNRFFRAFKIQRWPRQRKFRLKNEFLFF